MQKNDKNNARKGKRKAARTFAPARNRLALAVSMGLLMNPGLLPAAEFNVSNNNDSEVGSLRQAVIDANASPGDDTITFDSGLGVIALSSGQIEYTENLIIRGPAEGLIISGEDSSRIFAKPRAVPGRADLTIENLVLTNGFNDQPFGTNCASDEGDGGAICTRDGNVTLINSVVANSATSQSDSKGGGIFSYSTVTLENSVVVQNETRGTNGHGGGIRAGRVVLSNSLILGNSTLGALARGAGFDSRTSILTNSTVAGNTASGTGSTGAGFDTASLEMTSSTVSGNAASGPSARGGAFSIYGSNSSTIQNSTITGNSAASGAGGIEARDSGPSIELISTILSANTGPDGNFGTSASLSASNSLFGDAGSEINGTSSQNIFSDEPELLALADNGCAVTAGNMVSSICVGTHDMEIGSPAIDNGSNPLGLSFDQRGGSFARVIGPAIDIGALETRAPAELVVTNSNDAGEGSLRDIIEIANAFTGADEITFSSGLAPISLTSGQIDITGSLTIDGPLDGQVIDGTGNSRIFAVTTTGAALALNRLRLINAATATNGISPANCTDLTGQGGAVCSLGPLSLDQVTISGSSSIGTGANGGAVYADSGLTMGGSIIEGNSTGGNNAYGGGIFANGEVTIINSAIDGNSTTGEGGFGAGLAFEGSASLTTSTVSGNVASGDNARGGGVYAKGNLTLTNSTLSGNQSASYGGGIYQFGGNLTLSNSTITANNAGFGAGGIEFDDGSSGVYNDYSLELKSSILAGNVGPAGNLNPQDDNGSTLVFNAQFSLFGDNPDELDSTTFMVFSDAPEVQPLTDNGCAAQVGAPGVARCVSTHLLSVSSPAVDLGANPLNLFTDQRGIGFARDIGLGVDIGSVEIDPGLLFRDGFEP